MNLGSLLSIFQPGTEADKAVKDADIRVPKGVRLSRLSPDLSRLPEGVRPSANDDNGVDRVDMSAQATFVLAASQFDPRNISADETQGLAARLVDGSAITERDGRILTAGPKPNDGETPPPPSLKRDLLREFQDQLASDIGRNDFISVNQATRAVSILGRVASIRDAIE